MPGQRYTIDDLKIIANSPLCTRPDRLPALEEWMGPSPTSRPPAAARQASSIKMTSEDIVQEDGKGATPKRSAYGLSRANTTEDIVLGPPKMAFASASVNSRKFNNDNEPTERCYNNNINQAPNDEDKESPKAERFSLNRFGMQNNHRDKGERNGKYDRNIERDQRGQRRGDQRTDSDGWTNVTRPPRKSFGVDEGERFRRVDDRTDKEPYNKDHKDRPSKYETFGKGDREQERPERPKRRDTQRRDESSWFLPDDVRAARNAEKEREFREQREQRGERDFRNGRGDKDFREKDKDDNRERDNYGERQYQRGDSRVEKDPEWLDAAPEESVDPRAHSMEEFQRWKERMRAGNASEDLKHETVTKEASPIDDEIVFSSKNARKEQKVADKIESDRERGSGTHFGNSEVPHTPATENNVDRFFSIWNTGEKTPAPASESVKNPFFDQPLVPEKTSTAGVTGRASKFKNFFNAPAPTQEEPLPQQQQTSEAKAEEIGRAPSTDDQAGFQRILGMLGRAKISSPASGNQPPASNPLLGLLDGPNFTQSKTPPAQLPFMPSNGYSGRSSISQSQGPNKGPLDLIQGNGPPMARDANSEFLLKLMRQADHPTPQGPPPPTFLQGFAPSQMPLPPNMSADLPFQKSHRPSNAFSIDEPSSQNFARQRQESSRGSVSMDHQRTPSMEQRNNHMDLRPPPGIEPRSLSIEQRILLEQRNGPVDRNGLLLDRGLPMDLRNMPPMEHRGLSQSEPRGPLIDPRGPPLDPRGLPMGVHMESGNPPWLTGQNQQGNVNAAPRPPPGFYGRPGPNNLPATGMSGPPLPFFGPGPGNIPPPFAQSGMPPPPNLQNLPPNFPFGLGAPPGGFPPFPPIHDGMMVGHPFPLRPDAGGLRSPPHQQQPGGVPPGMFTGR